MTDGEADQATRKLDTPRRRRLRANWTSREPTIPLRLFIDYAWDNYDPKAVASYLLAADKGFYHQKRILYEGFCTWVVCPSRSKLREDSMVYRIAKAVDAAEAPWRSNAAGFIPTLGDFVGRLIHGDMRFFQEAYYPTGGAMRVLGALPRAAFKRALAKRATEMLEAVHMMAIYHFHLTHLTSEEYDHALSKETCGAVVGRIFRSNSNRRFVEDRKVWKKINKSLDRRKIIRRSRGKTKGLIAMEYRIHSSTLAIQAWDKSRPAIAYAYAAASIPTDNGRTLLHELIATKSTYKQHRHLLVEWCGRARYVVDHIIAECSQDRGNPERGEPPFEFRSCILPVEPRSFDPPALFSLSTTKLTEAYDYQRKLTADSRRKKANTPLR
ncbi:hypothetical protein ABEV34_04435 [Methylorubrum rhodesianum]|uniref:hypothetical protein n=1 Tax=Methylorubrum rhodesianum TaxID=29427 RepID=UPI003D28E5F5